MKEVLFQSALAQAQMIRAGEISSVDLCRLYQARIAQENPDWFAFVRLTKKRALLSARRADAIRRSGKRLPLFHGVPMGIKDLVPTRGVRTNFGSRSYRYFMPWFNAETAKRIYRGGGISLGKLTTSEFGALPVTEPAFHPPTRNPWNSSHTPGGSSGGSACAVAGALLPIAHASDGGGSIRIPASFCHLYGFKPSLSLLGNLHGTANPLGISVMGAETHTVADSAAMMDVLSNRIYGGSGSCLEAIQKPPSSMRIHMCLESPIGAVDPEVRECVQETGRLLESLGHRVVEVSGLEGSIEEFSPIWQFTFANIPIPSDRWIEPLTAWLRKEGKAFSKAEVEGIQQRFCRRLDTLMGDADVLLSPTVAVPAPRIGAFSEGEPMEIFRRAAHLGAFTAMFNLWKAPAASLPLGLTQNGLPIGVQLGARVGQDHLVLKMSRQLEEAAPWLGRIHHMWKKNLGLS